MLSSLLYYKDIMKAIYAWLYVLVSKELLMPQSLMAIEFEHFPQGRHKDESHVSEQMPSDKGQTGGTAEGVYLIPTQKHPILSC